MFRDAFAGFEWGGVLSVGWEIGVFEGCGSGEGGGGCGYGGFGSACGSGGGCGAVSWARAGADESLSV